MGCLNGRSLPGESTVSGITTARVALGSGQHVEGSCSRASGSRRRWVRELDRVSWTLWKARSWAGYCWGGGS